MEGRDVSQIPYPLSRPDMHGLYFTAHAGLPSTKALLPDEGLTGGEIRNALLSQIVDSP
jgi:hypothetical protein